MQNLFADYANMYLSLQRFSIVKIRRKDKKSDETNNS